MLKKLAGTLALTTLLFSATSQALPIVQADAFTAGDNKAALETSTGLVWMDFGINNHQPFIEIENELSTTYAGWRFPTVAEVDHLWTSLFGGLPEWRKFSEEFAHLVVNDHDDYFRSIGSIIGVSFVNSEIIDVDEYGNHGRWLGDTLFYPFSDGIGSSGFVQLSIANDDKHPNISVYLAAQGFDVSSWHGAMLVRDTQVSEPSSFILYLLALAALFIRYRQNC